MQVTEDVNVNIDLRELSPEALKEILNSNKQPNNRQINRTPDGESVRYLVDKTNLQKRRKKVEKPKDENVKVEKKRRVMSAETREKISEALKKRRANKNET